MMRIEPNKRPPFFRTVRHSVLHLPSCANKHVFLVAPAAPFGGCLHACSPKGVLRVQKIFFACGAPRIPLEIFKETVFSLQCFSFGPGAVLGGAYMLVRGHACSHMRVLLDRANFHGDVPPRNPATAPYERVTVSVPTSARVN